MILRMLVLMLAAAAAAPAVADEGMWTFDNFPADAVKKAYGVEVTPTWLDHVRLSTVRLTRNAPTTHQTSPTIQQSRMNRSVNVAISRVEPSPWPYGTPRSGWAGMT